MDKQVIVEGIMMMTLRLWNNFWVLDVRKHLAPAPCGRSELCLYDGHTFVYVYRFTIKDSDTFNRTSLS